MPKRFSNYKWALRRLGGTIPASGPIAEYNKYITGVTPRVYTARAATSKPGALVDVYIDAFGFMDATARKMAVQMSGRVKTNIAIAAGANADTLFGHAASANGHLRLPGFRPAKAVIFVPTGASAAKVSDITKETYQKRAGASYTIPFGATVATAGEIERASVIAAGIPPANTVSFTPERFTAG